MITYRDLAELTRAPAPFDREGWLFELKHDGFRMLAAHRPDRAELVSRRGNDFADRFPEIVAELLKLPEIVLDAELVVLDSEGKPQFERLQRRGRLKRQISIDHGTRTDPACLFVFDLLELAGEDVRMRPLVDRKALLTATLSGLKRICYTDHVDGNGVALFKLADGLGLEGISRQTC